MVKKVEKRGRKKKDVHLDKKDEEITYKTYKFLGYCGCESHTMITDGDRDVKCKNIYVCNLCGKRNRLKDLKSKEEIDIQSRKKYLDDLHDLGEYVYNVPEEFKYLDENINYFD